MLNFGGKGKLATLKKELMLQNDIDREIARRNNISFVEEILLPVSVSLVPLIVFFLIISI